jgi:amino acid transporter
MTNPPASTASPTPAPAGAPLPRRFGLLPATALNMSNMIGVGPFITIPALMSTLGGPQSLLGWLVALLITIPDSLIWSELGAAMPHSGGSYHYLRNGFANATFGRLMAFLFIWQFILSGPLEIASGYIGFSQYLTYLWPGISRPQALALGAAVGTLNVVLLYRQITAIGRITVSLWIGTMITVLGVIGTGLFHFDAKLAFDFPEFSFSWGLLMGLGAGTRVGVYDYLGYYDVCYIGDEVKDPGRVIPRSVILSLVLVAGIYVAINLSIMGVVSWRTFVPASDPPAPVVSLMMEKIYGTTVANGFTLLVLWTAFASVFALLLGYSRIPYAAARNGDFFSVFARLHPTKQFPHISLGVIGAIAIACTFLPLMAVIDALLVTRILVQFIGQIFAVVELRRHRPDMPRPYRIWLYPLPALLALGGWMFVLATSPLRIQLYGLGVVGLGVVVFFLRQKWWPPRTPNP